MTPRLGIWYAVAALIVAGGAIALFLHYRDPDSPDRFADPERQGIYESGLDACIARAQTEVAGAQTGVTGDQIEAYCECAIVDVVEQLTDAEIALFNETETLSDETMETMETIADACSQQFLPN